MVLILISKEYPSLSYKGLLCNIGINGMCSHEQQLPYGSTRSTAFCKYFEQASRPCRRWFVFSTGDVQQ